MEIITQLFTDIWEGINSPSMTLPIINVPLGEFLIAVFVMKIVVDILMMFLGKSASDMGKKEKEKGH